jgi:hypothetical protein
VSDQVPVQLEPKIQYPDAARIALAAGPVIWSLYQTHGLMCFRTPLKPTPSGHVLVEEGYILPKTLPNGTTVHERVVTRTLTREEAVNVR